MSTAIAVGLAFVVALLGALVVGLLRSHADILRALHDLGVNLEDGPAAAPTSRAIATSSHAPRRVAADVAAPPSASQPFVTASDLSGELPSGGAGRVAVREVPHDTLLAFLSTGCGTCGTFWSALAGPVDLPGEDTRLVIVTNGADAESPSAVAELAPTDVVTLMSSEAWDDYQVPVSPYFVLVHGASGQVIGEGAGGSWDQVHDLLARAVGDASGARSAPDRRRLARMSGQDRADYVDAELTAAGILPGDPSLHPTPAGPPEDAR